LQLLGKDSTMEIAAFIFRRILREYVGLPSLSCNILSFENARACMRIPTCMQAPTYMHTLSTFINKYYCKNIIKITDVSCETGSFICLR